MKKRKTVIIAVLVILTVVLFLSAGGKEAERKTEPDGSFPGTEWSLESLNGGPLIPGSDITIGFDKKGMGGSGGCNSYSGEYKAGRNGSFAIKDLMWTSMACSEPEGVLQQESEYFDIFYKVDGFSFDGDRLVLTAPGGGKLVYRFVPPPEDVSFEGRWEVNALVDGELARSVAAGTGPYIVFSGDSEKGSMKGETGCGTVEGSYTIDKGKIVFSRYQSRENDCSDDSIKEQHDILVEVLENNTSYSISGSHLRIIGRDGKEIDLIRE